MSALVRSPQSSWRNRSLIQRLRSVIQPCNRRYSATADSVLDKYKYLEPGSTIGHYHIDKVVPVAELNLVSVLLTHKGTQAKHLHIARNDKNNAFGVAFRTTPMDDTGVPHILEHLALCGSAKFPVRDPFFKMLNRSLSTFMNALTASDWTMYPFSSQNSKDFKNLLSVYLDAAFYPLLREEDFRQEGWRLEHEDNTDQSSPIIYKGVVFNEMKGVFSSQHSIFQEAVQNHLLPDHTYGVCSGGLPQAIPDLSWEALKRFHASHYHPSNSRFLTYGDQPLEEHLQFIEETVLSRFETLAADTAVPPHTRWTKPRKVEITCRHNDMLPNPEKQTTVATSYLLTDVSDTYETNVMSLISNLLVSGENSPFYQSLIESNLGSDYAPVCGMERSTRDTAFSVGLEGVAAEDVDKVLAIISETFQQVAKNGFPQERVDALLSQIELSTKHQTSNFGLSLMMSLTSSWNHDADPTEGLQVNAFLSRFRQAMADDPTYLQKYVQKYFLDNKHQSTVIMSPDSEYEQKEKAKESIKLKGMVDSLTTEERESVFRKGQQLAENQMKEEDLACLPTILISDIDPNATRTALTHTTLDGVAVQLSEQPTNEVVYFHSLTDMSDLPSHLKPFIPLFCSLATRMGAGDMDYKQQSQQIDRYTGGLSISHHLSTSPLDHSLVQQTLHLSSFCLKNNLTPMFDLWSDIFNSLHLEDMERLSMLLKMDAASMVSSISHRGHQYAMTHSASSLSEVNRLREVMGGMTQVSFLKSLTEYDNQQPVVGYLKDIARHVLDKSCIRCSLNTEMATMDKAKDSLHKFLTELPGTVEGAPAHIHTEHADPRPLVCKTHFPMDFSVNYSSISVPTVGFLHPDFAAVRVMAALLNNKYLHREIREKGGAYGGGATGGSAGHMSFYSYRDPNSLKTIEIMNKSADWISKGEFDQRNVDEAIVSTFQKVDSPVAPGSRGLGHFLGGVTDEMKQQHRNRLLAVTVEQIKAVADRYLRDPPRQGVSLIGPENEAIKSDSDWMVGGSGRVF
ncbi:presequence protease, mitochondrial-like [Watersipora subatra]|uniref:presequence protease, mitochondrial-like n=1 Tax=Watersipora subatra TaxID=2589382 RepID=UPI00355B0C67